MQKVVKGATKPKATAPKAKYVEPIISTTYEGGHNFDVVMDSLSKVIGSRSGSWPSIYKALIVIHIMIREGSENITLDFLGRHQRVLDIEDHIHRAPAMGRYARYLACRGQQFQDTKIDHVRYKSRQGFTRLHSLPIHKGLMRECDSVLIQLEALMKCQYQEQDIVNDDVLLMAYRLLVHDALSLFQVLNEGVINLLEHFFELSKPDAEQALDIYRGFRRITSKAINFLRIAKELEFKTMLHVPNIKHAPTSLVSSLEMYLNDPDFEKNYRQYMAEKQAHDVKQTRSHDREDTKKQARSISTASAPAVSTSGIAFVPQETSIAQQSTLMAQPASESEPIFRVQTALNATYSPDSSTVGNPFWQSQQEATRIQNGDGQAQLHMQQLRHLQMQQLEQQVLLRRQIQQLEQQKAAQAPLRAQHTNYFDGATAGSELGIQPAPPTQLIPQTQFEANHMMQSLSQGPADIAQPVSHPAQPLNHNPFNRLSVSSAAPLASYNTGSNPFKSPQSTFTSHLAALDDVSMQMQPTLIDFGQPQAHQTTGTNPFR